MLHTYNKTHNKGQAVFAHFNAAIFLWYVFKAQSLN